MSEAIINATIYYTSAIQAITLFTTVKCHISIALTLFQWLFLYAAVQKGQMFVVL